jgi:uncharacterized membrane protein
VSSPDRGNEIDELRNQIARLTRELNELSNRVRGIESRGAAESPEIIAAEMVELVPDDEPITPSVGKPAAFAENIPASPPVQSTSESAEDSPQWAEAPPAAIDPAASHSPATVEQSPFARASTIADETGSDSFEKLVGGRVLTYVGAFTMILAIAFFIPWAWRYFSMPPWIRIAIFHVGGLAFLAGAHVAQRKGIGLLAQGLAGVGVFALYASAFAAHRLYGIWGESGPTMMLAECAVITFVAIAIAIRAESAAIIVLGALGGYLTPVLVEIPETNHFALFTYLAFLNVSLVSCAVIKSWSFLKPLGAVATGVMFVLWLNDSTMTGNDVWSTECFAILHWLIFLIGATLPPVVWKRQATSADLIGLAVAAMGFLAITFAMFTDREGQQLAFVCWGLSILHGVLFWATYSRVTNVDQMPRAHLALAAVFFTLAAPLQLDGEYSYLGVAWSTQGLALAAVAAYFRDKQMTASSALVLLLATGRLFIFDLVLGDEGDLPGANLDQRFIFIAISGLATMGAGAMFYVVGHAVRPDERPAFASPVAAVMLASGNLWIMISVACQWDSRLVLLIWMIDAAIVYGIGFWLREMPIRYYALMLSLVLCGGRAVIHLADATSDWPLVNDRFGSLAALAGMYFVIGWVYRSWRLRDDGSLHPSEQGCDMAWGVAANVVLFAAITMEIDAFFDNYYSLYRMARMATYSIVWSVYAAALIACGFGLKYPLFRIIGLIAYLPILAKVFFIDMASLDLLPRVLALAVLGLMLLAVSFLYQWIGRNQRVARQRDAALAPPRDE